ncbi:GNAT family N-acetyltransferase [Streptomyces sp. NPDC056144]|uniref:GNAT family N-acetyltransferase n=1 Tax=unclassified Streptomyces TaxID=2593676 RepID=UPI0035DF0E68
MDYVIRTLRADEWEKNRELRLAALQDPVAHLAFLDTYEKASAQPDAFWQERTVGGSEDGDGSVRQFVAEAADGRWVGSVSVLVERAGAETFFGDVPEVEQAHVVGVFVRDEARGSGVIDALFAAAVDWCWSLAEPEIARVRLIVHAENGRAQAAYRRLGFGETGVKIPLGAEGAYELEFEVPRPAGQA